MPRSSCLPGLPTRRIIQTAPLLFGIANATRRGYILKRAPPDNSLGISSARISSRGYRLVAGGIRMVEGWGGPRFWSAASRKLKKKLVSRFYARLVSYGKLGTTLGFHAMILLYYPSPSFARWGEGERPWNGLRFCFRFWFRSSLRGRGGGWVIVADTVSLFRYGVFFRQCAVL